MNPDFDRPLGIGLLVVSDRSFRGERPDASGPALVAFLQDKKAQIIAQGILPDGQDQISDQLRLWVAEPAIDLILTCGGTGVSPRDVTPEATRAVIDRELPGFGERMRAAGREQTLQTIISRALAGTCGETLIVNLPGRPEAAVQNLAAVWPAIHHAAAKLQGSTRDCFPPSA